MGVAWILLLACAPPPSYRQWVWTETDALLFQEEQSRIAGLSAGVLVAEVVDEQGRLQVRLRMNPLRIPREKLGAVVIRLDDGVHRLWERPRSEEELDAALERVLKMVDDTCGSDVELQLDYDAPVRLLPRWAEALGKLMSLRGRKVWLTSIVAHLEEPSYGDLFREKVHGHILQVFDTGTPVVDAVYVAALARRAEMPYRLGIGAFERGTTEKPLTHHRDWFKKLSTACPAPRCESVWVFPAGQPWDPP